MEAFGGAHNDMFAMMQRHQDEMSQMTSQMFKGFGMGDPFRDDPFFNGSGFGGGIDKMMKQMRSGMMEADLGSMGGSG